MSETVHERDARRIRSALDAMRAGAARGPVYDWSRSCVAVNLHARELYSYGRHFPLARYVPRAVSGRRELFVINGDDVGSQGWGNRSRTPEHQSAVRAYVQDCGADSVVIPFSALAGARIELDSIRPIHVRPDATWTETRYADSLEDVPRFWREFFDPVQNQYVPRAPDADGRYSWTEHLHRLGDCLFSARRAGTSTRARYLSSFDYEERAPLYFLVQVPRGAGDTVEFAIDSLAPRAVWAARAREIPVYRQGDIFFIETGLTDIDLWARGVTGRARLTQWDRSARARRGETGYVKPLTAKQVRAMRAWRRAEYLRITRDARIKLEHREAPRAGPKTDAGARARWAKLRAADARNLELARARLRAVTLGRETNYGNRYGNSRYGAPNRYSRISELTRERHALASRVQRARESLETVQARAARNAMGRAISRDTYRAPFTAGPAAIVAWGMADASTRAKFYPHVYGAGAERARERVRSVLSIYGTAHTAREVCRVTGGAVYVRGRVSHRPELDRGRPNQWDMRPDHRPLELAPDKWYLAIRNTVPRARR